MARLARADLVDPLEVSAFHCIQRCVRQCYLCGQDPVSGRNFEHRKAWLEERLRFLAACFGIEVLAFAILSNHFHLVLRNRPDVVSEWTDEEVARRWLRLCPLRKEGGDSAADVSDAELAMILHVPERLAEVRRRLSDISWLMRMISEPIARRANREDGVAGRFWSGRFKAVKLCDEAALLACCAYVDLNAIRAGLARTPEDSDFTSVQRRIEARVAGATASAEAGSGADRRPDDWLAPVFLDERADAMAAVGSSDRDASPVSRGSREPSRPPQELTARCSDKGFLPMTLDEYLELIDWTGRQVRRGKRGSIASSALPILDRLGISTPDWLSLAAGFGQLFARVAGRSGAAAEWSRTRGRRFHPGQSRLLGTAKS